MNALINFRKFSQPPRNWLRCRRNFWNGGWIFLQFWRKSSGICRGIQDNKHLTGNCHKAGKNKKPDCKILRVWNKKWRELWKLLRKFWHFVIKLYGKLTFLNFCFSFFLGFLPLLRKNISLEDKTSFLQFSPFRDASAPPAPTLSLERMCGTFPNQEGLM